MGKKKYVPSSQKPVIDHNVWNMTTTFPKLARIFEQRTVVDGH